MLFPIEGVAEAAVVGVPDDVDGHGHQGRGRRAEGADLTVDAVRRHCRARLEPTMVPRHIEIHDELPKTDSGKIRKTELR